MLSLEAGVAVPEQESEYRIRRIAVLGAGTMGSRIASHIANAGFPVLLLDVPDAEGAPANGVAGRAMTALRNARPAAFVNDAAADRVEIGNFRDDLDKLAQCDWVIEAIIERLDAKQQLLAGILPYLHSKALVSSNTSGIPLREISKLFPNDLRRRWMGTHFFNPPRYMRLFELIPGTETDPAAMRTISDFAELHLGKTVVKAKDTPNFIANRIGVFFMLDTMKIAVEQGLTIEEVDSLTGSILGWPKTATFRLADLVGVDVVAHVAKNFSRQVSDERSDVSLPAFVDRMVAEGRIGDKVGEGFYAKRVHEGKEGRFVLDLATLEYLPAKEATFPELADLKSAGDASARLHALFTRSSGESRASTFYWAILPDLWSYAAERLSEVSDRLSDIDTAMTAGFNWQLGPFEMWDASGVDRTVTVMRSMGKPIPAAVETLLASGNSSWYRADGNEYFDAAKRMYVPVPRSPRELRLKPLHGKSTLRGNRSISLIDLGDGVACFELHSKMNSLGRDLTLFFQETLATGATNDTIRGFVIGTEAEHFSVGANLVEVLSLIEEDNWKAVERFLVDFQSMTRAIKFSEKPVVAAIAGMCLGGGAEVALHAATREAHLELAMGLVETGVGLIPGGGGCKEMTLGALRGNDDLVQLRRRPDDPTVQQDLAFAFENIAMAKISTSAPDARRLHLLKPTDRITMNRSHLLANAKQRAITLAEQSYRAPEPLPNIPVPGRSALALLRLRIYLMREGQFISEYDAYLADKLALVLCGGDVLDGTAVSEEDLLGLERETFLSLCGERATQERIAYTLKTGKPLRN